jgi:transcriptional regulator with XRE-family HTH domain
MDDDGLYYRRQGFWLRMAREKAGKSQEGAAKEVGLAEASKSTISDYERGKAAPQPVLRKLARWYGVPIDLFNRPPILADEVIDRLIEELSRDAGVAERRDWDVGLDRDPASDDEDGDAPHRRSA